MAIINTKDLRSCLVDKTKLQNCVSETIEGNCLMNRADVIKNRNGFSVNENSEMCDFSRIDSLNEMRRIGRKSVSHFVDLSE